MYADCCAESMTICRYEGELKCVIDGVMFKSMVLSEEGLRYSRFLFAKIISDPERKEQYLKAELLTSSKWRYLAYRSFINLLTLQDLDRRNEGFGMSNTFLCRVCRKKSSPQY